jgi:hypothetical protein
MRGLTPLEYSILYRVRGQPCAAYCTDESIRFRDDEVDVVLGLERRGLTARRPCSVDGTEHVVMTLTGRLLKRAHESVYAMEAAT